MLELLAFLRCQAVVVLADNPHHTFEFFVLRLGQFLFETAAFLLADPVHTLPVILGNVIPIYHDLDGYFRVGCGEFFHRIHIPIPHVRTGLFHGFAQKFGNVLKKLTHAFLLAVCQNPQEGHTTVCLLSSNDGYKVSTPLLQCDFINADDRLLREVVPVDTGPDTPLNRSINGIIAYFLFAADIFDGAVDQLQHQIAVVRFRVRAIGIVPIQLLRGRLAATVRAFISLGPHFNFPSIPLGLCDPLATVLAFGAGSGTLDRDEVISMLIDLYTDYFHLRNIQWQVDGSA